MIKKYFKIWWLQAIYMMVQAGFISILYVYFVKNEINFWHIILAEALGYLFAVIFISLKRNFATKRDMLIGYLLILFALLVLLLPFSAYYLLIPYMVLKISGAIMFFTPYNILFFEGTNQDKKVHKMTVYWAIGTVVGIVAPLLGGYIFVRFGLLGFTILAILVLLIGLFFIYYAKNATYKYRLKDILVHIKGARTITMLDGGLQNVSQLLIALFLLNFIKDEFDFGKILSIIALISVVFSFKLAKISDKFKKRIEFIWPLSFLSALVMISFYFVNNLFWAVVLIVLFKFITILFNPLRSNILLDKVSNGPITWISREIYLNIGRFFILGLVAFVVYLGFLREAFVSVAILYLIFPIVVRYKKIYAKIN